MVSWSPCTRCSRGSEGSVPATRSKSEARGTSSMARAPSSVPDELEAAAATPVSLARARSQSSGSMPRQWRFCATRNEQLLAPPCSPKSRQQLLDGPGTQRGSGRAGVGIDTFHYVVLKIRRACLRRRNQRGNELLGRDLLGVWKEMTPSKPRQVCIRRL